MQGDKGDCWSFIINGFVGLLVGAVKSLKLITSDGTGEMFTQACYVDIADGLRWCSKVLGEEVDVMKTNQS